MNSTITKKQAGVIYGAWKRGEIEAEKSAIDMMYFRFVGYGEQTTDAVVGDLVMKLRSVIDSLFAKDGKANGLFSEFADSYKRHYDDAIFAL